MDRCQVDCPVDHRPDGVLEEPCGAVERLPVDPQSVAQDLALVRGYAASADAGRDHPPIVGPK